MDIINQLPDLKNKNEERLRKRRDAERRLALKRNEDPVKRAEHLEKRRLQYKNRKQKSLTVDEINAISEVKNQDEERMHKKRDGERRRALKRKENSVKRAEFLEKKRLEYKNRKQKSLVNHIKKCEKWKEYSFHRRQIKKKIEDNEERDGGCCSHKANSLKRAAAQKKSKKIRKQRLAEVKHKDEEIKELKKKCETLKKRYQRLSSKLKNNVLKEKELKASHIEKKVLFAEVLEAQIESNFQNLQTSKEKQIFTNLISGKIIKKYRMQTKYRKFLKKRRVKLSENFKDSPLTFVSRSSKNFKIEEVIQTFFEMDDHSRMCPGKKEFVRKGNITKQKRFLTDTMKNLHSKFEKLYPDSQVSYSQFCKFRPFWVKFMKVSDRETCKCITHENIDLLIKALFKYDILEAKTCSDVINVVCCTKSETCCLRECINCKQKTVSYKANDKKASGFYWKWMQKKETYRDKKTGKDKTCSKIGKQKIETFYGNMIKEFEKSWPLFLKHEGTIIHQYNTLRNFKENLSVGEALIHMDWSENWSAKYAQEVQSYHFGGSRKQISLHTVVAYVRNEKEVQILSYCTLSESLIHSAVGIWTHLFPVLDDIFKKIDVTSLHFLSDGPATQYKNKTMFHFLGTKLIEIYPTINNYSWNYHESGHGKGAPDGIGAVCKRTADRLVAEGKDVADFDTLIKDLQANCEKISIIPIQETDFDTTLNLIQNVEATAFTGTQQVHQVVGYANQSTLSLRKLSCFQCNLRCTHYELGTIDLGQRESSKDNSNSAANQKSLKTSARYEDVYSSDEEDITLPYNAAPNQKSLKHRVRYEDVYSSDEEDITNPSKNVNRDCIKEGTCCLVQLGGPIGFTKYRIAGVCQEKINESNEVNVCLLKSSQSVTEKCIFNEDIELKIVFDQIETILPVPNKVTRNKKVIYEFPQAIPVLEFNHS